MTENTTPFTIVVINALSVSRNNEWDIVRDILKSQELLIQDTRQWVVCKSPGKLWKFYLGAQSPRETRSDTRTCCIVVRYV